MNLPAPLAGVSSLCHLDHQTQVIYQPIALVNLSCQGRDSTSEFHCSVFCLALEYPGAFSACNLLHSARARVYTVFKKTLPRVNVGLG